MGGNLTQQCQCLATGDGVTERWRIPLRRCLFSGDLARAYLVDHESQKLNLGVRDADNNAPILVGVQPREGHRAFAVDQASDVGGDIG